MHDLLSEVELGGHKPQRRLPFLSPGVLDALLERMGLTSVRHMNRCVVWTCLCCQRLLCHGVFLLSKFGRCGLTHPGVLDALLERVGLMADHHMNRCMVCVFHCFVHVCCARVVCFYYYNVIGLVFLILEHCLDAILSRVYNA